MADTPETVVANPIPKTLEPPPRSTGDASQDYPLLLNYMVRAAQVVQQCVAYINKQVTSGEFDPDETLPDPATATTASAQSTANDAYTLAKGVREDVDNIDLDIDDLQDQIDTVETTANTADSNATSALASATTALSTANNAQAELDTFRRGTVTVSGASASQTLTFSGSGEPDTAYDLILTPASFAGTPAIDAFVVKQQTKNTGDFTITVFGAPGIGNSVTFSWVLIRI